ncbi:beta-lactamase family protein [Luteimonas sp. Y-2-2-4F]|nr:serine hydrolase domain-containing protein [Luteimonas sp. Y-2-2-4F]MCD9033647.1 beta-lactamase family protein [Luteimonas sp. Y-2-2-4F]
MKPDARPFRALRSAWLLWLLLSLAVPAQALETAHLAAQLEQLRAAAHAPGATAAVMVGGELAYAGGVGVADAENAVPADGASVHNIGSVSKVVGAIAVMQLVEQGKVDLDAEIQAYAPWFPRKQAPVTVRRILTHTSGIRHYRDGEFGEGDVLRFRQYPDIETATRFWRDDPLLFDPGTRWSYSSHASNLLQAVIEQASGQDMESYLRERIWRPAGMAATQFDVPVRIVPRRARGYEWDADHGTLGNAVQENVSYKYVGGGILASDEDMVRLGHALNAGRLLGAGAIAEMYRPQLDGSVAAYAPPGGGEAREVPVQGLIWRVQQDPAGRRYVAHSGSVKGTLSYLANWPEQDVVVALHVNARGGEADLRAAAEALAAEFLPGPARD